MTPTEQDGMPVNLPSMEFCDHQHPSIVELASQLRSETLDDEGFAVAAFEYVQALKFVFEQDWSHTASTTLVKKEGNCFSKANLLTALLRAGGLHAGFYVQRFHLSRLGWLAPWLVQTANQLEGLHCLTALHMHGRWLKLDPDEDLPLKRVTYVSTRQQPHSFDGKTDCVREGRGEGRYRDDIDFIFNRLVSGDSPNWIAAVNLSLDFAREGSHGKVFEDPSKLYAAMYNHLYYQHPELIQRFIQPATVDTDSSVSFNFCDHQHSSVQQLANVLRTKASTDEEFAIAAFKWVRDKITYFHLADWRVPVEETIASGVGVCSNKSCLLVALLRAGGLTAAFNVVRVPPQQLFPVVPKFIKKLFSNESWHVLASVYLHGRWIAIDPMADTAALWRPYHPLPENDFDGKNVALGYLAMLNPVLKCVDSIDDLMRKTSRVPKSVISACQIVSQFNRLFGAYHTLPVIASGGDVEAQLAAVSDAAEAYLVTHHPDIVADIFQSAKRMPTSKL